MFDQLSDKLEGVFKKLRGQGKLTEANIDEALREVRRALLEADVNYKVARDFIKRVKERALGQEVLKSITPGQQVVKVVHDEMVVLRNVRFNSHCEHHMVPIIGCAHVGYLPDKRVIGISKLARVVDAFAKRLQIQEKMTAQIADALDEVIHPRGVGVVVEAAHHCMTTRGIQKQGVMMVTSRMLGTFRSDPKTRREFLAFIGHALGKASS